MGGYYYDHGTSCAGQIVMTRDNGVCGVGVAYDAKVAGDIKIYYHLISALLGIRILGGPTTDVIDAMALSYGSNGVHIYSNSWGPYDDGYTLDESKPLTLMALQQGAMTVMLIYVAYIIIYRVEEVKGIYSLGQLVMEG